MLLGKLISSTPANSGHVQVRRHIEGYDPDGYELGMCFVHYTSRAASPVSSPVIRARYLGHCVSTNQALALAQSWVDRLTVRRAPHNSPSTNQQAA